MNATAEKHPITTAVELLRREYLTRLWMVAPQFQSGFTSGAIAWQNPEPKGDDLPYIALLNGAEDFLKAQPDGFEACVRVGSPNIGRAAELMQAFDLTVSVEAIAQDLASLALARGWFTYDMDPADQAEMFEPVPNPTASREN